MDTKKLKELAELASKATPGPWWIDSHGHCMVSESQDHRTVFLTNDGMGPATRHPETGNLSHWPNDWDASYIASADPTTILELIAEVERLRSALSAPETITAEPASDYDTLRKQFMSLRTLANSNAKMVHHWRQQSGIEMRETLLVNAENVNAERTINEQLTYSLLDAEDKADRLKAENEALRQFAAEAYQVLGALDAPENVLDNASDAASGVPPRHETLLPFFAEGYEALRKDAERWRYARTILPYEVIQDSQKDFESWGADASEAENKRCDDAIDAALEGGGR